MMLDWSDDSHWNHGKAATCRWCGRGSWTLDSAGRPAHKSCVEALFASTPAPVEPVRFMDLAGIIAALGGKCPACRLFPCGCEAAA